jgi:hypothetical protein
MCVNFVTLDTVLGQATVARYRSLIIWKRIRTRLQVYQPSRSTFQDQRVRLSSAPATRIQNRKSGTPETQKASTLISVQPSSQIKNQQHTQTKETNMFRQVYTHPNTEPEVRNSRNTKSEHAYFSSTQQPNVGVGALETLTLTRARTPARGWRWTVHTRVMAPNAPAARTACMLALYSTLATQLKWYRGIPWPYIAGKAHTPRTQRARRARWRSRVTRPLHREPLLLRKNRSSTHSPSHASLRCACHARQFSIFQLPAARTARAGPKLAATRGRTGTNLVHRHVSAHDAPQHEHTLMHVVGIHHELGLLLLPLDRTSMLHLGVPERGHTCVPSRAPSRLRPEHILEHHHSPLTPWTRSTLTN